MSTIDIRTTKLPGHQYTIEEEQALRADESTNTIAKRDTKTSVDLHGQDPTWRAVKNHQKGLDDNAVSLALEGGHAAFEGAEISGAVHAGWAGVIGGAVVGFGLGLWQLSEAHHKGDEQAKAITRDNVHVALIGALDLPASYKAARFNDYKEVPRGAQSQVQKMTEALTADKKGLNVLQMHADRGMNAADRYQMSGMKLDAFFKANPDVAAKYRDDAAYREGFDAFISTKISAEDASAMRRGLQERNGWYAQAAVSLRG